jgi:hypothetical protein
MVGVVDPTTATAAATAAPDATDDVCANVALEIALPGINLVNHKHILLVQRFLEAAGHRSKTPDPEHHIRPDVAGGAQLRRTADIQQLSSWVDCCTVLHATSVGLALGPGRPAPASWLVI